MSNIHYTVKNTMGGSFCKKCLNWSSLPDGLKGYECFATKEEIKENKITYKQQNKCTTHKTLKKK